MNGESGYPGHILVPLTVIWIVAGDWRWTFRKEIIYLFIASAFFVNLYVGLNPGGYKRELN